MFSFSFFNESKLNKHLFVLQSKTNNYYCALTVYTLSIYNNNFN